MFSLSSLFSSPSLQIIFAVSVVALSIFGYGYFRFIRQMHIGYGMTLTRRESDSTVWVIAVLKNSPADKAGIKKYMRVLLVDSTRMIFNTDQALRTWSETHRPSCQKQEEWIVQSQAKGISEINLLPVFLPTHPVLYWTPEFAAVVEGKKENKELVTCHH